MLYTPLAPAQKAEACESLSSSLDWREFRDSQGYIRNLVLKKKKEILLISTALSRLGQIFTLCFHKSPIMCPSEPGFKGLPRTVLKELRLRTLGGGQQGVAGQRPEGEDEVFAGRNGNS